MGWACGFYPWIAIFVRRAVRPATRGHCRPTCELPASPTVPLAAMQKTNDTQISNARAGAKQGIAHLEHRPLTQLTKPMDTALKAPHLKIHSTHTENLT